MSKHYVEFDYDTDDKYNTRWTIYAEIIETKDTYGTGDSPTGYECEILRVSNGLYDEDLEHFDRRQLDYLEEMAIEVFVDCGEGYHG